MTRGEHIAAAVREHLFTNGLKQSQLTGDTLAEIANRVLDHLDKLVKKKKRLATEEDWIKELESEPHLAGIDIRKELSAAQFWCKNNSRECTRKFFVNWLNRAEKAKVISPGGVQEKKRKPGDYSVGPAGWLELLTYCFPGSAPAKGGMFEITEENSYQWEQLDLTVRAAIWAEFNRRSS